MECNHKRLSQLPVCHRQLLGGLPEGLRLLSRWSLSWWWQRWGSAFDGLHLFMGYQTVTWDNDDEGRLVATYALQGRTIRESWIQTAIDVQGPSEVWAVMGPINNGNWVNYNDHFWGRGSVGPDIRGGNLDGWWIIWGPS